MSAHTGESGQPGSAADRLRGGYGGLLAILAGIVLGALVGVFYGHAMWVAMGGPQQELERLERTENQKRKLADEAEQRAAEALKQGAQEQAQRYRDRRQELHRHILAIRAEMLRLQSQIELHNSKLGKGRDPAQKDPRYLRANAVAATAWELIHFAGDLFLRLLKLLVIPLVVTSMVCGVTSLGDIRNLGKVGGGTIFYYLATGAVAVILGIVLVQIIRPGQAADDTFAYVTERVAAKEETGLLETVLNVFRGGEGDPGGGMFPENIFLAASQTNVLALIAFALVFGGALTTIGAQGQAAIDFFAAANEAVMKMVHLVMYLAPIGVFGLVAANIAKNGGGEAFLDELRRIGWYVATVLIGLSLHMLVLGSLLAIFARRNPLIYTYRLLQALLTAVSTASSSATLPVTMECVEELNGVSKRSASFVLPLGATLNMDGTALYEAVAVIFIAQSLGIDLSTGQLVVIFLTATLAAIGAAGIPEAGLVTMVIVLTAVGLPLSGIGTILAIDWFLDRMRTAVNVYGDAIGAGIIDRMAAAQESP